jgi:hypothetical protein
MPAIDKKIRSDLPPGSFASVAVAFSKIAAPHRGWRDFRMTQ